MPNDKLLKEKSYTIEFAKVPLVSSTSVTSSIEEEEQSNEFQEVVVANKKLEGEEATFVEVLAFSYEYRVSKYASFDDKYKALRKVRGLRRENLAYVQRFSSPGEKFENIELRAVNYPGARVNRLIVPTSPSYKNTSHGKYVYSHMYRPHGNFIKARRPNHTYVGLVPVNGLSFNNRKASFNTAYLTNSIDKICFYDHKKIVDHWANKISNRYHQIIAKRNDFHNYYTHRPRRRSGARQRRFNRRQRRWRRRNGGGNYEFLIPKNEYRYISTPYKAMYSGNYNINFGYRLPGKGRITSTQVYRMTISSGLKRAQQDEMSGKTRATRQSSSNKMNQMWGAVRYVRGW